ncbi:energy coupling factor transporter S component ThiW [Sporosarcina sp. ANT_H38]|uniref:energy coupling factor transporter S component ThiW n=1 Tax=Sporosarcina sp. ANT_H38 TaxID=2597358 RepID=UPI0011F34DC2|nr:energy coupling factor transporter S component ThiW [Sporosarcina sp. ANT_H38]KAA0948724.1 energy coupling factor transporter S component ThiW [Sporosarcina sp. ANT_H38]
MKRLNKTNKLTLTSIIIAITTLSSHLIFIPVGFTKIFPIQHFSNLLLAVLLGPWYAVSGAFIVSTLRNMLGTGSIFAYPGSMIGALLAGYLFLKTKKIGFAFLGEVVGTGIIGATATYPIGVLLFGRELTLFGFIPAFMISSFTGATIAFILLTTLTKNKAIGGYFYENSTDNRRI